MSQSASPDPPPTYTPEHLTLVVDIWKHSVGVQMHFNDMGMKIRNLYFTILAAAIGLIGVLQGHNIEIPVPPITIHLVLFVMLSIVPISMLFFFLDKHWYHRLLLGAVKHCATIEGRYRSVLPELQLGAAISSESPVKFDGLWRHLFWFIRDERFRDRTKSKIHSDAKLEVLYKSVIWGMLVITVVYAFVNGIQYQKCSALAWMLGAQCLPTP